VLNRVRHPAYPHTVCGVVYQGASRPGCQFSFACNGALGRAPDPQGWRDALEVADRALDGFVEPGVGASTHYHALWVRPAWSTALTPTARIGGHQFYRLRGSGGEIAALSEPYAGAEPPLTIAVQVRRGNSPSRLVQPARTDVLVSVWGLQVAAVRSDPQGGVTVTPATVAPAGSPPAERRPADLPLESATDASS
jgi:hypothetical protein